MNDTDRENKILDVIQRHSHDPFNLSANVEGFRLLRELWNDYSKLLAEYDAKQQGADGYVLIEHIAVENFMRSTDVPRFKRMCETALAAASKGEGHD